MALRGTLTHRKTRRLARLLEVDGPTALGILEALWHVTAEGLQTKASKEAEADYFSLLAPYQPKEPLTGATELTMNIFFPYLKSDISTKANKDRCDEIPHTSKPDLDNWVKQFIDCLVRLRFIEGDQQIVTLWVSKYRHKTPGIECTLRKHRRSTEA